MADDQFEEMRNQDAPQLPLGDVVAGKYRIDAVVGRGGMGTVYRVTNIFFEKEFAMKVLDLKCAANAVLAKRFQIERKRRFRSIIQTLFGYTISAY